jgi:hypothetical protein
MGGWFPGRKPTTDLWHIYGIFMAYLWHIYGISRGINYNG